MRDVLMNLKCSLPIFDKAAALQSTQVLQVITPSNGMS